MSINLDQPVTQWIFGTKRRCINVNAMSSRQCHCIDVNTMSFLCHVPSGKLAKHSNVPSKDTGYICKEDKHTILMHTFVCDLDLRS